MAVWYGDQADLFFAGEVVTAAPAMRQQQVSAEANRPRQNFRQRNRASRQDIMNTVQQRIGRADLPW
jgi:hypothetical protein